MSARAALVEAVTGHLRGRAGLAGLAVFDAPPVRAVVPYAVVDEPVMGPWGTKSWAGYEARIAVGLWDEGERPVRGAGERWLGRAEFVVWVWRADS